MTPEEFAKTMEECKKHSGYWGIDIEVTHIKMDDLMCNLLTELGYENGVKIFRDTEKWYA